MQSDTLVPFALTTRSKVKNRAGIGLADTSRDILVDDLINEVSELLQTLCNRKFLNQAYLKELYDTDGGRYLFLKQLPVTAITTVYIRGGNTAVPVWTAIDPSTYFGDYLDEGMIRFWGPLPHNGRHLIAVDYTAGYLIDFTNELDTTKHNLPFDLVSLATQLCVKNLNGAAAEGLKVESVEGLRTEYDWSFSPQQQAILNKYIKHRLGV